MTDEEKQQAAEQAIARNMPEGLRKVCNADSDIKKVIGVMSGKGGVGKSFITSLMASISNKKGLKTAILDADITGPSIPKAFGVHKKAFGTETSIFPVETASGIKLMSINLLVENEAEPVIWRGPVIGGAVQQFWTDVMWGDIDVMFVDMPPGTGDVPLTVFQSMPIDGVIIVTSPQELVEMIVSKAVIMTGKMNIPVLGIVENMSYFECPDCKKKHEIFGPSRVDSIASAYGIECTARIPINSEFAACVDSGNVENINTEFIDDFYNTIMN